MAHKVARSNNRAMKRSIVLVLSLLAAPAFAQQSSRNGTWEVYLGPVFTDGKSYSFEGGSSARTDTGVGFNLGFARNIDRHWAFGMDFGYRQYFPGKPGTAPGGVWPLFYCYPLCRQE